MNTGQSKDKCPAAVVDTETTTTAGEEEQPKVVRTKAVRCTRPLFGFADHITSTSTANLNSVQLKQSESKCEALGDNCIEFSASETVQEGNIDISRSTTGTGEENSDGSNMWIDTSGDMLTFEGLQQVFKLDFESLAFFLDSEEWLQI